MDFTLHRLPKNENCKSYKKGGKMQGEIINKQMLHLLVVRNVLYSIKVT